MQRREAPRHLQPGGKGRGADEEDVAGMTEEWLRWFPSEPPARQGAKLPVRIPGLKVSIAAIAEG